MSEPLNFRSAFNGFNREDVVHYIEYLKSNHENQVRQLRADLAAAQREEELTEEQEEAATGLQEQFEEQEAALTALNAEKEELTAKCAQLEATLAALYAEKDALAVKTAQLEAQLNNVSAERDAAISATPRMSPYMEEELAAYRRAERVERLANERASAVYRKLRVALQDTTAQADQAVTNLDNITSQVNEQLNALRDSLANSKSHLESSISSLDDICPKQIAE
jgi:chromosome segregation ATPase